MNSRLLAETLFVRKMITELYPNGFISLVCDTYDYWGVLGQILPALKDVILARDGRLVIRPDSGDPVEIVCGTLPIIDKMSCHDVATAARLAVQNRLFETVEEYETLNDKEYTTKFIWKDRAYQTLVEVDYESSDNYHLHFKSVKALESHELTMEEKGSIEVLWEIFGGTVNEAGYKVLDSHIGLIYGDSITLDRADTICARLAAKGFASQNIVFGIGSYTYQMNSRDTFGTAMKATDTSVENEALEIYKDPATGDGNKKSAKGLLMVTKEDGEFVLHDQVTKEEEATGELKTRFKDGLFHNLDSIKTIRERLDTSL